MPKMTFERGSHGTAAPVLPIRAMMRAALDSWVRMAGMHDPQQATEQLAGGEAAAWRPFQHALSREVGACLGCFDADIETVYLYEPSTVVSNLSQYPGAGLPLIHLLVHARRETAAQGALVDALDRALVEHTSDWLGMPALTRLLDVQVIADNDIESWGGRAYLLSLVPYQMQEVWARRYESKTENPCRADAPG